MGHCQNPCETFRRAGSVYANSLIRIEKLRISTSGAKASSREKSQYKVLASSYLLWHGGCRGRARGASLKVRGFRGPGLVPLTKEKKGERTWDVLLHS